MTKKSLSKKRRRLNTTQADAGKRRLEAYEIRRQAALYQKKLPLREQPRNGDEELYKNKIGNYTKGLPHNQLGEVDHAAYKTFVRALEAEKPTKLESIPLGGTAKLTNPQGAFAFDLAGPDSHHLLIKAPPPFSSAREAGEMAEIYWQALVRDVPFADYSTNELTLAAAADLTGMSHFQGPKVKGKVTPDTLFRGMTPGDLSGPYISQFLWKNIPYGATTIVQRYRTTIPDDDYMTAYTEWLAIQNGQPPAKRNEFDPVPRFIRNGRDLGEYVHWDFIYQTFLSACLILLSFGEKALDSANPYLRSKTQTGLITFGAAHILDFVSKAARTALEGGWCQKFLIHRRLRPEEFAGRVHNHMTGAASYPIHIDLVKSRALTEVFNRFGTYLLPLAYPEGCPTHPAFPAGHACIAGAAVTILKAFFNETFEIPEPVIPSPDGLTLLPYKDSPLTIGGELNKLAANIALGRDTAGVHWRSDGMQGMQLGEAVAIGILEDYSATYNEKFSGFSFTKFDGKPITIEAKSK